MRHFILLSLLLFGFTSSRAIISNVQNNHQNDPVPSYDEVLAQIKKDKANLKSTAASKDSCQAYLLDRFENYLFPYWVGTKWDYNGYTNRPGNDKIIACGYFVSTTLKHMGFNWNRYDLAKMYSLKIVQETCSNIEKYTDKNKMIKTILHQPDNLYIVGLDSHVGFILKRNNRVWFVHSNYYEAVGPQKELAIFSPALESSNTYYIGVFFNDSNIDKWLSGSAYVFSKD